MPPNPPEEGKRNKMLWKVALGLSLVGIVAAIYWYFIGQYRTYTTDAYVGGNFMLIHPQIEGVVSSICADDTNLVQKGQLLVQLDPTDKEIALQKARAELGNSVREISSLFAQAEEMRAQVEMKQAELKKTRQDLEHRQALIGVGGVSLEDLEHAQAFFAIALADLLLVEFRYKAAIAQVENSSIITHPRVEAAKSNLRKAWVERQRCQILAPLTGIIAHRTVQVGEIKEPLNPLLGLVPLEQMWIEANFKERNLRHVRVGQPAKIHVDFYGDSVEFYGQVVGIGAGTGSVFSLLPPQNATGNWIKIVQRVPVRIAIPVTQILSSPLRLGLSAEVTIDTHDRSGTVFPPPLPSGELYESPIYGEQLEGVEEEIEHIIEANLNPHLLPLFFTSKDS